VNEVTKSDATIVGMSVAGKKNGDMQISLDLGLRIWKAGWVQALAGSNPASSASRKHDLTCGKRRSDHDVTPAG
jgi:hypothetical protein